MPSLELKCWKAYIHLIVFVIKYRRFLSLFFDLVHSLFFFVVISLCSCLTFSASSRMVLRLALASSSYCVLFSSVRYLFDLALIVLTVSVFVLLRCSIRSSMSFFSQLLKVTFHFSNLELKKLKSIYT